MAKRKLAKTINELADALEFLVEYPGFQGFIDGVYSDEEAEAFLRLITVAKEIRSDFNDTLTCSECDETYENHYPTIEFKVDCPYCAGEKERPEIESELNPAEKRLMSSKDFVKLFVDTMNCDEKTKKSVRDLYLKRIDDEDTMAANAREYSIRTGFLWPQVKGINND